MLMGCCHDSARLLGIAGEDHGEWCASGRADRSIRRIRAKDVGVGHDVAIVESCRGCREDSILRTHAHPSTIAATVSIARLVDDVGYADGLRLTMMAKLRH